MASPPHIPQINIPRKRNSISSVTSAAKKRKPSQLRNSFAPDNELAGSPARYSRSPSVDSVAAGSLASGVGGRRRKKKDGDAQSTTDSARGGRARSAVTGVEGEGGEGDGEGEDAEDDDDDLDEMDAVLEAGRSGAANRQQEKEHEKVLLAHMDVAQNARYELYRRTKLKTQTVRKLVNQTLSQSVPQPVIIAVGSYTKAFVGEIIDRALTVRDEWAACRTHIPNPDLPVSLLRQGFRTPAGNRVGAKPNLQEVQAAGLGNSVHAAEAMDKEYWVELGEEAGLQEKLRDEYKGPLTPAHLREALRRYNKDREGGGAGFAGMSLEGVERTLARTGGKRLFR